MRLIPKPDPQRIASRGKILAYLPEADWDVYRKLTVTERNRFEENLVRDINKAKKKGKIQ